MYKNEIKEQKTEICDLENRIKVKIKNAAEVVNMKKAQKAEIKSWKKDLGDERRQRINLEKKT